MSLAGFGVKFDNSRKCSDECALFFDGAFGDDLVESLHVVLHRQHQLINVNMVLIGRLEFIEPRQEVIEFTLELGNALVCKLAVGLGDIVENVVDLRFDVRFLSPEFSKLAVVARAFLGNKFLKHLSEQLVAAIAEEFAKPLPNFFDDHSFDKVATYEAPPTDRVAFRDVAAAGVVTGLDDCSVITLVSRLLGVTLPVMAASLALD